MNKEEILVSLAIIFSFLISPVGIILGIIALRNENIKQNPALKRIAIISIVIGLFLIIVIAIALSYFNFSSPDPSNYLPTNIK